MPEPVEQPQPEPESSRLRRPSRWSSPSPSRNWRRRRTWSRPGTVPGQSPTNPPPSPRYPHRRDVGAFWLFGPRRRARARSPRCLLARRHLPLRPSPRKPRSPRPTRPTSAEPESVPVRPVASSRRSSRKPRRIRAGGRTRVGAGGARARDGLRARAGPEPTGEVLAEQQPPAVGGTSVRRRALRRARRR